MSISPKISTCLWFDGQAEEAARFYTGIFKNSSIGAICHYPAVGQEIHGNPPGKVMTVEFTLDGSKFTGLNGGPHFKFSEAISFEIHCETQEEIDYFWEKLREGGDPESQQCGWLKDKFGVSWQVVPAGWEEYYKDHTNPATQRAFAAMLEMKKLDIAALKAAYDG